jgi:DNA-binding MarR family transcriptional regulator
MSTPAVEDAPFQTADRLHSAAIHLLRRLRSEDSASGLSAPRLSALSVVVFAGPLTMSALAEAEQVRPPTISRLVKELEAEQLVEREQDPQDRRVLRVRATPKGRRLLEAGRKRRVARLAEELGRLAPADRKVLARAARLLERLATPSELARRRRTR